MIFGRKDKTTTTVTKKQVLVPSVISADMHLIGNVISPEGALDIDGQINGNVRCHTVSLRENGKVVGDIIAEQIYIYGIVEGTVKARSVTLYASARVTGSIMHEALSIEDGAFVDGKFKRTDRIADEELFAKRIEQSSSIFSSDNDNDNGETSEAELIVLENLRLIR